MRKKRFVGFLCSWCCIFSSGCDNVHGDGDDKTRLQGHKGAIYGVTFCRGGRYALSVSGDKTARLWDLKGKREVRRFVHQGVLWCVAVLPQDERFVSGGPDQELTLWDMKTGEKIRRLTGKPRAIAVSNDGDRVLIAEGSGAITVVSLTDGSVIHRFKTRGIWAAAFSPDGKSLVVSPSDVDENDNILRIWDIETSKQVGQLSGHTGTANALTWSSDNHRILSGGDDKTARLWDVKSGKQIRSFKVAQEIFAVAFSPDGQRAIVGTGVISKSRRRTPTGIAYLWNLRTGKKFGEMSTNSDIVFSAAFSADGRRAILGAQDGTVHLWNIPPP